MCISRVSQSGLQWFAGMHFPVAEMKLLPGTGSRTILHRDASTASLPLALMYS